MSNIVNTLNELNVENDALLNLSYTEGADVWHINESHVEDTVAETFTANRFAGLLASNVPVFGNWGDVVDGADILNEMRANGALDDYERGDYAFEEYISNLLAETIYDNEYSLEYSTEQYDYKRGRCDISVNVRVRAADVIALGDAADSIVSGFEVSVKTPAGTLTLNQ